MRPPLRVALVAFSLVSLNGCLGFGGGGGGGGGNGDDRPAVALTSVEPGHFESSRPGTPIPLATLKTMDERQVASTFGRPVFQRDENGVARLLRFRSDACDLDLFLYATGSSWQVRHAEARDRSLRTLPADRCAGSVAAQRR
jgi:hypothetical protein